MHYSKISIKFLLTMFLFSGCASSAIDDKSTVVLGVNSFAKDTRAQLDAAEVVWKAKAKDEAIVQARRKIIADNRLITYPFNSDTCRPFDFKKILKTAEESGNTDFLLDEDAKIGFREKCPFEARVSQGGVLVGGIDFGDPAVNSTIQGPLLSASLREYADALVAITDTTDRNRIVTDAGTALDNSKTLAMEIAQQRKEPLSASRIAVFDNAKTAIEQSAALAIDTARYNTLKEIVTTSDESVRIAVIQIANALDAAEGNEALSLYRTKLLVSAENLDGAVRGEELAKRLEYVSATEDDYEAVAIADEARSSLKFVQIARAHAALAYHFDRPPDAETFDTLGASVAAVNDLAKATKELVSSVEQAKDDKPVEGGSS